jgi:hypothetical protein
MASASSGLLYQASIRALRATGLADPVRRLVRDRLRINYGIEPVPPVMVAAEPAPISVAPHNIQLLRYLIERYKRHDVSFITCHELYGSEGPDPQRAYATLRHDVDYTPENLSLITDLERELSVRSEIHIIVDGSSYDPEPYAAEWRKLAEEGFVFGLHTLAPSEPDFFTKLRDEISRFEELMGFAPPTFSIHGVCPSPVNWRELRERFIARIQPRMGSFGFIGSHNFGGVGYWIEDSGAGGEFAYLHDNWIDKMPAPGEVFGILAHPDHWVSWPSRWHWERDKVVESPRLTDFVRDGRGLND